MASKTFLELVNGVVDETKITLDHLTSANFASPPRTTMYNRFKNWVNMAYEELLIDRPEWKFRAARGIVEIYPRIQVKDVSYTPAVGDVLVGELSGVEFTIEAIHRFESSSESALDYTFSVTPTEADLDQLILDEPFDLTVPAAQSAIAYFKGPGSYNFGNVDASIDEIHEISVRSSKDADTAYDENLRYGYNSMPVTMVKWEDWQFYNQYPWNGDRPQYMTQAPDGNYFLWPQPANHQLLTMYYSKTMDNLETWDDVPGCLPEKYQDYLIWRATQEYADFDGQQKLFLRAGKHVDRYLAWLGRDQLQQVNMVTWSTRR